MRPLRLEMQALGPYAGRQILDFAELKGRRFFLIHGPTGSGKTTILDAMVFALYGDTSGAERSPADMRSDHADPGLLTEVVFDFALGPERYRVWRRPAQERPKLRGGGTTMEPHDATLWRLSPPAADSAGDGSASTVYDEPEMEPEPVGSTGVAAPGASAGVAAAEGRPLAAGWSKVSARCERLLGFRAEQFRQVVMLPQGRFQELLRADSAGRAEILSTLFGTRHYARLERGLKDAAAACRKDLEKLAHERRWLLDSVGLPDEQSVDPAVEQAAERLAAACEQRARLDDARGETEAALQRAESTQRALDAAAEATGAYEALRSRRREVDDLSTELRQGAAAALVVDSAAHAARCRDENDRAAAALAPAEDAARAADARLRVATAALQAQKDRADEREQAGRRLDRLQELRGKVATLATANADRDVAEKTARHAAVDLEDARKAAQTAAALREAVQEELSQTRGTAAREQACRAAAQAARERAERGLELVRLKAALETAQSRRLVLEQTVREAEERWREACENLKELESRWAAGQAALLAKDLRPGAPCPVCGATDHPAPATTSAEMPGSEQLAAAKDAVAAAHDARDAARAGLAEGTATIRETAARATALEGSLGEAASADADVWQQETRGAEAEVDEACAAAAAIPALESRLAQATAAATEAESLLEAARRRAAATDLRCAETTAVCEERAADVPEELRDPQALERGIAVAAEAVELLRSALEQAEEGHREAERSAAETATSLKAAREALAAARRASAEAGEALADRLRAQGFVTADGRPDHDGWLAAQRDDERLRTLRTVIESYERQLAEARGRAEQAARAAAGLEPPDIDELREATAAARSRAEAAAEEAAAAQGELDRLEQAAARLAELRRAAEDGDRRFAVVGRLAQLINGENPRRLTLQRFVLGAYLDAVLVAADRRLLLLSKGRYRLVRTEEQRGGRRSAGLDFDVYDAWTGFQRPVSTLSGGESFMAALCLALGLAETVQAYSGGVYLDTVFIDEGFGTLDDEALDLAVATLMDLQQGDRLVGIISHVTELRDRIDARLQVTAERGTSTARFVVP